MAKSNQPDLSTPQAALREIYAAFNSGDVDTLLRLYDPDAVLITSDGKVTHGRDALRAALTEFYADGFNPILAEDGQHYWVITDNIAKTVGRYIIDGNDPEGKPAQIKGTEIVVLRKQVDGRWLLLIENTHHDELLTSVSAH